MKKTVFVILFSAILLSVFAGKDTYVTHRVETPIVIDGNAQEWKLPFQFYESKTKLQYTFANDNTHLYICMRVADENAQMKILRAGMSVWVDAAGKKNQNMGIQFPLSDKRTGPPPMLEEGERPDVKKMKQEMAIHLSQMNLVGFKNVANGYSALKNDSSISVAIDWDKDDIMTYEISIPLFAFYNKELVPKDSTKLFAICFVVNGLEKGNRPQNDDMSSTGIDMRNSTMNDHMGNRSSSAYSQNGLDGQGPTPSSGSQRGSMMTTPSLPPIFETDRFWHYTRLSVR